MRWSTLVIAALLAVVQGNLWFGKGNWRHVVQLNHQLDEQHAANDSARVRNERTAAEISDLKEGAEMVEEKARQDLGMLRENELLVQVKKAPK